MPLSPLQSAFARPSKTTDPNAGHFWKNKAAKQARENFRPDNFQFSAPLNGPAKPPPSTQANGPSGPAFGLMTPPPQGKALPEDRWQPSSGPSYPYQGGPLQPGEMERNALRSKLRGAYMPATNPVAGDPLNIYGSQTDRRVGEAPATPLPPVGQYAKNANLNRVANSGGSESYFAQNALAGNGPPPIAALPNGAVYDGTMLDSLKSKLHPEGQKNLPRLESSSARSGSAADMPRIALNRLRSGSSLNPDEQAFVDGIKRSDPQGLQEALAGSVAQRKASAQEVLRQRGLERGDARAAARNYNMMVKPRNVMMGTGQTVSMPGMPANVAALRTMGGSGASPLNMALTGMLPANAAVGFDETARRGQSSSDENASREKMGQVALAKTLMESDDPAEREQGKAIARSAGIDIPQASQPGVAGPDTPLTPGASPNLGLTNEDAMALSAINRNTGGAGSEVMIEQYGKRKGWSPAKIAEAKQQYGTNMLERGADWLYSSASKIAPYLRAIRP